MSWRYLTLEQVVTIHHRAMLEEGQQAVLVAPDKLEGALVRPQAEAFGEEFFPLLSQKGAALLQGVVIAHLFLDGNKRAGLLAMLAFLEANGVTSVPRSGCALRLRYRGHYGRTPRDNDIAARIVELFGIEG